MVTQYGDAHVATPGQPSDEIKWAIFRFVQIFVGRDIHGGGTSDFRPLFLAFGHAVEAEVF